MSDKIPTSKEIAADILVAKMLVSAEGNPSNDEAKVTSRR